MRLTKTITREVKIEETSRVLQMAGIFDVPPSEKSRRTWNVDIDLPEAWNVGCIVGPSMSGKTTLATELFDLKPGHAWNWPKDKSILDGFPRGMSIKDIVGLLSSVGFSSPPDWLKPFAALSNGGQFRVNLARTLAETKPGDVAVVDEFGSLVHQQVRKIAGAAAAKAARSRGQKLVAVTCHEDCIEYLEPDWVLQVAADGATEFTINAGPDGSRRWVRPDIVLKIIRTDRAAWSRLFAHHHYLSGELHKSARCFAGLIGGIPAAFTAVISFPHPHRSTWREHRTVCLPDMQGIGVGNAMSEAIASIYAATGKAYTSTTSHPAMIRHRAKSPLWKMTRRPGLGQLHRGGSKTGMSATSSDSRITAGFEYIGPTRPDVARRFGLLNESNEKKSGGASSLSRKSSGSPRRDLQSLPA